MNICVYGAASKEIDRSFKEAGETLGKLIAQRSHRLIFGGGSDGLMGALARGVHENGGYTVSVAPSFFNVDGVLYESCDEYITTETMRERKQIMEDRAEAFIVTPGGIGTFEEFLEILTLRQLDRHQKPIAVLNTNGYYDPMMHFLQNAVENNFMSAFNLDLFFISKDPKEVLDYVEGYDAKAMDVSKLRFI